MKIKELILFTRNLELQIEFYTKVLELEIVFRNAVECTFLTGDSLLTLFYQWQGPIRILQQDDGFQIGIVCQLPGRLVARFLLRFLVGVTFSRYTSME